MLSIQAQIRASAQETHRHRQSIHRFISTDHEEKLRKIRARGAENADAERKKKTKGK